MSTQAGLVSEKKQLASIRLQLPMKMYKDGSRDVDFDKVEHLLREAKWDYRRGGYVICSQKTARRDTPWKSGMTAKRTFLTRLQQPDNKLVIRNMLSDRAYSKHKLPKVIVYLIDGSDISSGEIDALESHLIKAIKRVNPNCYNISKTSAGHKALIAPNIGIIGVDNRDIGGVMKGTVAMLQDAAMFARTMGLGE